MTNRLMEETSPYLLQHAHNPVDWYPWGEEALEKARTENKPIFLSIGYSACHWCHVMAHESFENEEIAALLNRDFVSIKVDREERPDIDSIYMGAVVAMTGSGGWPMSVFLTPEGRPFYGGTYFPPARRYGMPSFKEVLIGVAHSWKENRGEIYRVAEKLTNHLEETATWAAAAETTISLATLQRAADELMRSYDRKIGAWGQAPLFPQPMSIEFLLQQATRAVPGALDTALHALRTMQRGGMYDVVGGGFHRYSTDAQWLVPHFEKMLYDNAQLAQAYLHGYLLSRDEGLLQTCTETLDFILRELRGYSGGFTSSLDADSEGEEGKFYLWTEDEVRAAAATPDEFELAKRVYGLTPGGNHEGRAVLRRDQDDHPLAEELGLPVEVLRTRLNDLHARLLKARSERVRPPTDDKVLVSWNALALQAFAEAARYLDRQDYLEAARKNAAFLLDQLYPGGQLKRAWRNGQARHDAFLEDYAGLILGLLALYQVDPDPRWFDTARQLGEQMTAGFRDERGGFYSTRADQSGLILRPKELQDGATPAGNSLAAYALLQMAEYTGRSEWFERAEHLLSSMQNVIVQYPSAFGMWLKALDFAVGPVKQVAIVYPQESPFPTLLVRELWHEFRPRTIAAVSALPASPLAPALLDDRPAQGEATAYVCQGFVCQLPVTDPEGLRAQLAA